MYHLSTSGNIIPTTYHQNYPLTTRWKSEKKHLPPFTMTHARVHNLCNLHGSRSSQCTCTKFPDAQCVLQTVFWIHTSRTSGTGIKVDNTHITIFMYIHMYIYTLCIPLWKNLVELWNMFVATSVTIDSFFLTKWSKNTTKCYPVLRKM